MDALASLTRFEKLDELERQIRKKEREVLWFEPLIERI